MLYRGSSEIQKVYLGSTPLSAIYHGINKIYPKDQPGPDPEPLLEGIVPYADDPENLWQIVSSRYPNVSLRNPILTYSRFRNAETPNSEWLSAASFVVKPDNHSAMETSVLVHARLNNLDNINCITLGCHGGYRGDSVDTMYIGSWVNNNTMFLPRFSVQYVNGRYYNLHRRLSEYYVGISPQVDTLSSSYAPMSAISYGVASAPLEEVLIYENHTPEIWSGNQMQSSYAQLYLERAEQNNMAQLTLRTFNKSNDEIFGHGTIISDQTTYDELRNMSAIWFTDTNLGVYHVRTCAFLDSNDNVIWDPLHGWQL